MWIARAIHKPICIKIIFIEFMLVYMISRAPNKFLIPTGLSSALKSVQDHDITGVTGQPCLGEEEEEEEKEAEDRSAWVYFALCGRWDSASTATSRPGEGGEKRRGLSAARTVRYLCELRIIFGVMAASTRS